MSDWNTFDYEARLKTRPTDYLQKDKDKQIPEAMAAFVSPLNEREEVEQKIYLTQSIYNATGIDLDRFGEYVGLARNGLTDDEYRKQILRVKFTLGGSGTEADLMKLAQAITNFAEIKFVEHKPAAFIMHASGPQVSSELLRSLDAAAAAGVRAYTTHDYGEGSFELAGIDVSSGMALKVGNNTAMQVAEDTALGIGKGSAYLGGSRLGSTRQTDETGGVIRVITDTGRDSVLSDDNGNMITALVNAYDQGTPTTLAGAYTKEDEK